ncbi:MAG: hypothetical protein N2246_08905 [Candidatus Sumerlaeia bacterium]|nr:hypothetical protein [Candidatus Sumerlaeia bacterium]
MPALISPPPHNAVNTARQALKIVFNGTRAPLQTAGLNDWNCCNLQDELYAG